LNFIKKILDPETITSSKEIPLEAVHLNVSEGRLIDTREFGHIGCRIIIVNVNDLKYVRAITQRSC
jgi:hypothetical protein